MGFYYGTGINHDQPTIQTVGIATSSQTRSSSHIMVIQWDLMGYTTNNNEMWRVPKEGVHPRSAILGQMIAT